MRLIVVSTTVATRDDARRIAQTLVERRLAACAEIAPIESLYVWDGALHHEPEQRIRFKTTAARYAAVEAAIRELHPYALPAIDAVAIEQASAPYAAWVADGSSGDAAPEGAAP